MSAPSPVEASFVDRRRLIFICALAASLGVWAALVAKLLLFLIELLTSLFFQHDFAAGAAPIEHPLGWWVVLIPPLGGLIVGLVARFGTEAIRGPRHSRGNGEHPARPQ